MCMQDEEENRSTNVQEGNEFNEISRHDGVRMSWCFVIRSHVAAPYTYTKQTYRNLIPILCMHDTHGQTAKIWRTENALNRTFAATPCAL